MINGNTIVNLTDVFAQEYTSKTYTSHTGFTESGWYDGTTSSTLTRYGGHSGNFYSDSVRGTYTDLSFYSISNSTSYNSGTPNFIKKELLYWTSQDYTGNVRGETFYTSVDETYNNAQSWPFTPFTNTTIRSSSIDSTRRTTYNPTNYTATGTTTANFTSYYRDTDTVTTNTNIPIISYGATGTETTSGTYNTTLAITSHSTTSAYKTITDATSLISSTWTSFFTLGQTTVPAYWANYNERLAYILPVSGYPKDVVEWTQAYSDLGTKIDAGASFPAEGANFLTSVYDTQTELKTILKTTTTNTTSYKPASDWITHVATVTYNSSSSSTCPTTYQDSSVDTNGKLLVYSSTKSHTYTDTFTTGSNITATISLTTATISSWHGGFYTIQKSKLGNISFPLSGGSYTISKNGNEISYITTLPASNMSVNSFSTNTLSRLSTSYTSAETVDINYHGGLTSLTSGTGFYSDYQSYLDVGNSTVTQKKYHKSDMLSVGGTTSAVPYTQAFGLAQKYQTEIGVRPSENMAFANGWGAGIAVNSAISFVDFTTVSVYNGIVMFSTITQDLVSASQSLDSISATTWGTTNTTLGTGTNTTATSTTSPSLTSSYTGTVDREIYWVTTYRTNNLTPVDDKASFANNGFANNVSVHLRGIYKLTSFDSTGGDMSTFKSTYNNGTYNLISGHGLVIYPGGSKFLTLGFNSVASTYRGITKFTKT